MPLAADKFVDVEPPVVLAELGEEEEEEDEVEALELEDEDPGVSEVFKSSITL